MINNLLCFGLVFIPFYELITTLFLPAQSIAFFDTRFPKECVAFSIALAIILIGIYKGPIKPLKNIWLVLFIGFLVVNINKAPVMPIDLGQFDISNFWVWQPFLNIIVYFFMLVVVASQDWTELNGKKIFNIMAWSGFIMSLYIFLQRAGFDQIFYVRSSEIVQGTAVPELVGTLGAPSLVAPFLAICLVPALFIKKFIFAVSMAVAVFMIHSEFVIGGTIVALIVFYGFRNKKILFSLLFLAIFAVCTLYLIGKEDGRQYIFQDNGRFPVWSEIVTDLSSPLSMKDHRKYGMTGFGLGSYQYLFHVKHVSVWREAHNEYLELAYCTGIIGLGLFAAALGATLLVSFDQAKVNDQALVLMAVLSVLYFIAAGTFIWHLAVYQFYTIVVVGMIYQLRRFLYENRISWKH